MFIMVLASACIVASWLCFDRLVLNYAPAPKFSTLQDRCEEHLQLVGFATAAFLAIGLVLFGSIYAPNFVFAATVYCCGCAILFSMRRRSYLRALRAAAAVAKSAHPAWGLLPGSRTLSQSELDEIRTMRRELKVAIPKDVFRV